MRNYQVQEQMKISRLDRYENHFVKEKEQVKLTLQAIFMTTKSNTRNYQVQEQLKISRLDWGDKPKTSHKARLKTFRRKELQLQK